MYLNWLSSSSTAAWYFRLSKCWRARNMAVCTRKTVLVGSSPGAAGRKGGTEKTRPAQINGQKRIPGMTGIFARGGKGDATYPPAPRGPEDGIPEGMANFN